MKILDVKWYCAGHGNCGIVLVEDEFEGIKYYIGSFPGEERGHNEEEDKQWIADWGSSFPKEVGDMLFNRTNKSVQLTQYDEKRIFNVYID